MSKVQEHTLEYSSSSKLYKSVVKQFCEDRNSATDVVLTHNNSEEDQLQPTGGLKDNMLVFVINKEMKLYNLFFIDISSFLDWQIGFDSGVEPELERLGYLLGSFVSVVFVLSFLSSRSEVRFLSSPLKSWRK